MTHWSIKEETLLQRAVAAGQSGNTHTTHDWERVSKHLSERGYNRSANACKAHWKIIAPRQLEGGPFNAAERKVLVEMITRAIKLEEDGPAGPAFMPWSKLYEKISQQLRSRGYNRSATDCETFWRMIEGEEVEDGTNHSFNMNDLGRGLQDNSQALSQSSATNMDITSSAKSGRHSLSASPETQQPKKKKPRLGDANYPSSVPTDKAPLRSLINEGLSYSKEEVGELQQDVDSRVSNLAVLEKSLRDVEAKRGRIQESFSHKLSEFTKQLEEKRDKDFGEIERERATIQQALETEKVAVGKAKAKIAYIKKSVDMLEGLNEHLKKGVADSN